MRIRRTKIQILDLYSEVFELIGKGYDPFAICKKTGERRDLITGIISKILEDHPDFVVQIRIVHVSKTIAQLLGDNGVEFVEIEKDSTGAMILTPFND